MPSVWPFVSYLTPGAGPMVQLLKNFGAGSEVLLPVRPALSVPCVSILGVRVIDIAQLVLRKIGCELLISRSAKRSSQIDAKQFAEQAA